MIGRKTVFVVGAGASCVYDFPSGMQLLRGARDQSADQLSSAVCGYYDVERMALFRTAVNSALTDSLDSLLEFRKDIEHPGRLYIATRILRSEYSVRYPMRAHSEKDWLSYLFQRMDDGCSSMQDFARNPVTFLTYNYDRLLEYRISNGLRARYSQIESTIEESIARFWETSPVIHLHGSLGDLIKDHVPFGAVRDGENPEKAIASVLRKAADGIRIVHEADGENEEFERARAALRQAERVVFLGFGFGRTNVDRLGFHHLNKDAEAICCRFGMTDAEAALQISEPFKKCGRKHMPTVCSADHDCLLTLRTHIDKVVNRYA